MQSADTALCSALITIALASETQWLAYEPIQDRPSITLESFGKSSVSLRRLRRMLLPGLLWQLRCKRLVGLRSVRHAIGLRAAIARFAGVGSILRRGGPISLARSTRQNGGQLRLFRRLISSSCRLELTVYRRLFLPQDCSVQLLHGSRIARRNKGQTSVMHVIANKSGQERVGGGISSPFGKRSLTAPREPIREPILIAKQIQFGSPRCLRAPLCLRGLIDCRHQEIGLLSLSVDCQFRHRHSM